MSAPAGLLDAAERETLMGLADVLVPATGVMPAASEADRSGKWLARALRARPDLTPELQRVLKGARGRPPETEIERLQDADTEGYAALAAIVTGAYYMNIKVRKLIGYPGQKPAPPYPDEADYYLADGLLDPVRTRGRRYRAVPE
jgi:hypothetical protein